MTFAEEATFFEAVGDTIVTKNYDFDAVLYKMFLRRFWNNESTVKVDQFKTTFDSGELNV